MRVADTCEEREKTKMGKLSAIAIMYIALFSRRCT